MLQVDLESPSSVSVALTTVSGVQALLALDLSGNFLELFSDWNVPGTANPADTRTQSVQIDAARWNSKLARRALELLPSGVSGVGRMES